VNRVQNVWNDWNYWTNETLPTEVADRRGLLRGRNIVNTPVYSAHGSKGTAPVPGWRSH
jgi:hypothetical protein